MLKRIVQLLLSLVIVAPISYLALGYVGRHEAIVGIVILSLLCVTCAYDMLRLLLRSRKYDKRPTHPKRRRISKEEIKAAKEMWEREGRIQFQ